MLDQGQNLTLAKTIEIGRQYELSRNKLKLLRGEEEVGTNSIKSVNYKFARKRDKRPARDNPKSFTIEGKQAGPCSHCGQDASVTHKDNNCPAGGTTCKYCHKPDHWLAACRKRKKAHVSSLHEFEQVHDTDELLQIYTTQDVGDKLNDKLNDKWTTDVTVQGKLVNVRIDTGAKCSIIVKTCTLYDKFMLGGTVRKSSKILRTYSNHQLRPVFTVTLPVTCKQKVLKC